MFTAARNTPKTENRNIRKLFTALGTVNTIFVPDCNDTAVADIASARVREIHSLMSVFDIESDVYNINMLSGKGFLRISGDIIGLIKKAVHFSVVSAGAFDISTGPLTSLWRTAGKEQHLPSEKQIRKAMKLCGYENILLNEFESSVALRKKGAAIDLGGIAKGFAADEAVKILKSSGVNKAILNFGGNIAVIGGPWLVGIQDPFRQTGCYLGTIELKDETAVTSGSNEQFFVHNGKRYHHIIDPRKGRSADTDLLSVTAIGKCSADMDALSTAAFVKGIKEGSKLLLSSGAEGVFIQSDGSVYITDGLKNRFSFVQKTARLGCQ